MLESVKITRRQSEIRQALAALVGKEKPDENEVRQIADLDAEFQRNETRMRGALIAEDTERREAKTELETRSGNEWTDLIGKFELRQVAVHLDEGRALNGATAEVVSELRDKGGYRGCPVPWLALEKRSGETVASGVPDPIRTMPIIDRLFADSAAVRMGASIINIDSGEVEWPVASGSVTAGWAATETGNVAGPTVYSTTDRPMTPANTLGITMKITRKSLKQSGAALEQAVRRDINGAIGEALDKAVFRGAGSGGEPAGVLVGSFGITSTQIAAAATWAAFRAAVARFLTANAANGPGAVKLLIRPEVWSKMDGTLISGTAVSEWDRLLTNLSADNIVMSANALAAPGGSPDVGNTTALLTTAAGSVSPIFVGAWGAIDLIRDPYSDAASGGLRLTALATMDVTVSRAAQLEILTNVRTQ